MTPEQRDRFFQIYYSCRYHAYIAEILMRRASTAEKVNLWLLLIALFGSLVAGSVSWFGDLTAAPAWAVLAAISTVISVYSLIMAYGEKQYSHHSKATEFTTLALRTENYSSYAVHNPAIKPSDIDVKAAELHDEYLNLVRSLSRDHVEYSNRRDEAVRRALDQKLLAERKANPSRYIDPIL